MILFGLRETVVEGEVFEEGLVAGRVHHVAAGRQRRTARQIGLERINSSLKIELPVGCDFLALLAKLVS